MKYIEQWRNNTRGEKNANKKYCISRLHKSLLSATTIF
jgi:hypothetical protein